MKISGWIEKNAPPLLNKNIVIVTPELKSFKARAGGLGPAVEELAKALAELGLEILIIAPLYKKFLRGKDFETIDYSDIELEEVGKIRVRVSGEDAETMIKKSKIEKVQVYFLENEKYADALYCGDLLKQAIFLGRGSLELLKMLKIKPHIIHLNDGITGLVAFFMKTDPRYSNEELFKSTKIVFTIHNAGIGYQQIFDSQRFGELEVNNSFLNGIMWKGKLNLTYAALHYCDKCNTVSKDYEITLKNDGEGLKEIFRKKSIIGIVNGIDVDYWRMPELRKKKITRSGLKRVKMKAKKELIKVVKKRTGKTLKENKMIVVMPRRLADQKGFDILLPYIDEMCKPRREGGLGVQFIVLGVAHPEDPVGRKWVEEFRKLSLVLPPFVFIEGFDENLAKLMYWGGDLILYPSIPNKEPCGTGYMMAMVNGTPALATRTGGIVEKITEFDPILETGNGFLVWKEEYSAESFFAKMKEVSYFYYEEPKKWLSVCFNAFNTDVDIRKTAMEYVLKIYEPLF